MSYARAYSLNNVNILIIDDVITEGITLRTIAKKIFDSFPEATLYAATCGIMGKKRNMTGPAIKKYKK
jgi:hypoxanthine-guanine phosphoribosyltransferase